MIAALHAKNFVTALQETDVSEYLIPIENAEGLITEGIVSNNFLSVASYSYGLQQIYKSRGIVIYIAQHFYYYIFNSQARMLQLELTVHSYFSCNTLELCL